MFYTDGLSELRVGKELFEAAGALAGAGKSAEDVLVLVVNEGLDR